EAGLRGRELRDNPFGVVGRPDADAIARREPEREQAGGERIDPLAEFAIAPAHALLADDEARPVAPSRHRSREAQADRFAEQRHRRGAVYVAECLAGHACLPSTALTMDLARRVEAHPASPQPQQGCSLASP